MSISIRMLNAFPVAFAAVLLLASPTVADSATPEDEELFESRVRPLLLDRCIRCHSASTGKTSGGLALDTKQGWLAGGDSGPAIVPGDAEASLLMKAVRHADDVSLMPPMEENTPLTADEIATLAKWINKGAFDPRSAEARIGGMTAETAKQWWSFQPPVRNPPPELSQSNTADHPIDRFLIDALNAQGLNPNGLADRRTLYRRASFDLTGLPPVPDELAAFLTDESPDAWSQVIEQFLNSPAYGERWGRHWLDLARYADTAGDGADYPVREAWRYRNWVINAFNRNLPFNQFLQQQIAGDILAEEGRPEDYADHVTATGFLAVGKRYGYRPSPDFQHLDFADVLDTVGRSVLGLSLGCARCHDHKYDPVSAADYYALYGILQSTTWAFPGGEESKRPSGFPALIPRIMAEERDRDRASQLAAMDRRIAELRNEKALLDGSLFAGGIDLDMEKQTVGKVPVAPWFSAGPNSVLAEAQSPFAHVHPKGKLGIRVGSGTPHDGLRYVFERPLSSLPGKPVHFTIDFRTLAGSDPGGSFRFYLGRGVLASTAVECSVSADEFAVRSGSAWDVVRKLEPATWYTLQITLDHEHRTFSGLIASASETTMFEARQLNSNWDGIVDTFFCDGIGHVDGPVPVRDLDNAGLQTSPFSKVGGQPEPAAESVPDREAKLAAADAELADLMQRKDRLARQPAYEVAYGVSEGTPNNARIQKRGEPDKPGEEVPRRFLEVLGGDRLANPAAGSGRRELADWLTRNQNPLTARVFVNRVWQWHFGTGLVATSSDFGTRGEKPSHPELLDWLAVEFMESGWDVKSLHRTIMLSQAYRRSSDDNDTSLRIDPSNRLNWRYARRALDAESIRDSMLAVSGLLDTTQAEAHPFPPVEQWGFTIHQPFHAVYESRHRSVYLMLQRNRRHPFLSLFDAADPNQSVAERMPTITPAQSLYLMNSPFVHEASQAFAERLISMHSDPAARMIAAVEIAHGRYPDDDEILRALEFTESCKVRLRELSTPESQLDSAAWSALARVLLTANPFLYVD